MGCHLDCHMGCHLMLSLCNHMGCHITFSCGIICTLPILFLHCKLYSFTVSLCRFAWRSDSFGDLQNK
jgi:hypothetical protein